MVSVSVPTALTSRWKSCQGNVTSVQKTLSLVSTRREGLYGKFKGPLCEVAGVFTPVAARHARHACSLRPQLASHAVRGR